MVLLAILMGRLGIFYRALIVAEAKTLILLKLRDC